MEAVTEASVAKVASKEELNCSRLATLPAIEPEKIEEDTTLVVTSTPFTINDPVMSALTIFITSYLFFNSFISAAWASTLAESSWMALVNKAIILP